MVERWGPRPEDEIEREPPGENPVHVPSDAIGDDNKGTLGDSTSQSSEQDNRDDVSDEPTPSTVGDSLGGADSANNTSEHTKGQLLHRVEPFGPNDKEAARWNTEADHIEEWAESVGDVPGYLEDLERRLRGLSEGDEEAYAEVGDGFDE